MAQETRVARNAFARQRLRDHRQARAWCDALGATVTPFRTTTGALRYLVKVPGFAHACSPTLALAVRELDAVLADWHAAGARTGPTGARLAPLWAAREGLDGQ